MIPDQQITRHPYPDLATTIHQLAVLVEQAEIACQRAWACRQSLPAQPDLDDALTDMRQTVQGMQGIIQTQMVPVMATEKHQHEETHE